MRRPLPGPSPLSRPAMSHDSPTTADNHPPATNPPIQRPALTITTSPPPGPLPPPPFAWQWKCHRCNHAYRFSATSRCLDCGHRFCGTKTTTTRRPSRRPGTCPVAFDLDGWDAWGLWRRTASFPGQHDEDARAALFDAGTHDCTLHCDYPSQCKQVAMARRRAREREAEEHAAAARAREVYAEAVSPLGEGVDVMSWFSSSEGDVGVEVEYYEDAMDVDVDVGVRVADVNVTQCSGIIRPAVSPLSPGEEGMDGYFGVPCGMDGEEWREERMLVESLGHAETRPSAVEDEDER